MRFFCLFFALAHFLPLSSQHSISPEDPDGSGNDLEGSGSGSGDWSEGISRSLETHNTIRLTTSTLKMTRNKSIINSIDEEDGSFTIPWNKMDDSDLTFGRPRPAEDIGSAINNVARSKGVLENKEALAGIIAGGVVGVVLAVSLAAFMIYNMKKKDLGGYTLGQQTTSNTEYQMPMRKEQFIV